MVGSTSRYSSRQKLISYMTVALATFFLVCAVPISVAGQCSLGGTLTTWTDSNGDWNTSGNWDFGVPNSFINACITDGTSAVTLNTFGVVADLQLASGNSLTLGYGALFDMSGPDFINNGQVILDGGSGSRTYLVLEENVTLSGAGTLTLNTSGGGGTSYIYNAVPGITLTNQSTIQGAGLVGNGGLALANQGIINANSSGQALTLNLSGGITNTGTLEASGGGYLQLPGVGVNNAGGNITANSGSHVQIYNNSSIQGGTLTAGTGSYVQIYGGTDIIGGTLNNNGAAFFGTPVSNWAYLNGSTGAGAVTLNGTYTTDYGGFTYLYGAIHNNGNFQVNALNGYNSVLWIGSNVTLDHGGKVTLNMGGAARPNCI